jgi:ATP synthase protein I
MVLVRSKAIRTVLRWQVLATSVMALVFGLAASIHGAVSAMLGGLISVCAGLAFSIVASLGKSDSMGATLAIAFRAEATKITVAVVLLWLVFAMYKNVVAIAVISSFVVSIVIFAMAFFVPEA